MSEYRNQLEDYLSNLEVSAKKIFDVGGIQNPVETRVKTWNCENYIILDMPEFDLNVPQLHSDIHKYWNKADLVFCLEVFEYLIDPVAAIHNIKNLMKDGGRAIVTFAFAYPHHEELEMDSLRYTEFGIRQLADHAGLHIDKITTRNDRSGKLLDFYRADGMKMSRRFGDHSVTGFIVELSK